MGTPQDAERDEIDEFHVAMQGLSHAVHNGVNKHYLTTAAKRVLEAWKKLERRWEKDR